MSMIKKYLKKDIYLQKKGRKLLMTWDSQTRFKDSIPKSSLSDYNDVYIRGSGRIKITRGPDDATDAKKRAGEKDKEVTFKSCAPFAKCMSEISNT